jgi:LCP family protein required for cell wall assembly
MLWVVLGIFLAVLVAGAGSYLWFRGQIGAANQRVDPEIIEALREKPSTTLTTAPPTTTTPTSGSSSTSTSEEATTTSTESPVEAPTGMNIVLLGGDKRVEGSSEVTEGRSDVIILVHIDPEKNYLSMLSVPRDLRANIPGYGHRKINAAYAYGGGALVIRTIQSELGVDLDHYIGVDLEAFKAITDEIGGVYIDVDRPYNDGKLQFDPGYQLLDGLHALRFIRTRHDQNIDFGRNERQQRFLAAVRERAMGWNLPLKLPGLISAIFDNVDTDLGANEILKLAYWAVKLDGSRMKMGAITGATGDINGSFYILPTEEELANAVADFLTPPGETAAEAVVSNVRARPDEAVVTPTGLAGVPVDVFNSSGRVGEAAMSAVWLLRQGATLNEIRDSRENPITNAVVTYPARRADAARRVGQALGISQVEQSDYVDRVTVTLGRTYAFPGEALGQTQAESTPDLAAWRALAGGADFPVLAPTYIPPTCRYSFQRAYEITVERDRSEPAFRVGYRYLSEDKYLGFSGTTWLEAPLASPGLQVQAGDVTFTAVGTAAKTERVWWVKDKALYWVTNTLFNEMTREQLLTIAMSAVSLPGSR